MKVGVVGLGSIGLRHAQNLRDLGHEVIGYDPAEAKIWKVQDRSGVYANTQQRLQCFSSTRAVVIASPSEQHLNDLRTAVTYGVPALIEKPLAMSVTDELLALIAEMKNDELPAMVGYNLRFLGAIIKVKDWLDRGAIGNRLWAHFTCGQFNDKPEYQRDGVIRNWSHEIDLALYLLGPATVLGAFAASNENIALIHLQHDRGDVRSTIHLDYVTRPQVREFYIAGRKGHIHCDIPGNRATVSEPGNFGGVLQQPYHGSMPFDECYVKEMEAFLRRAERKPSFGATMDDGLAVLEICDQARKLAGLK